MAGRIFKLPSFFTCYNPYNLPEQYDYLSVLGEGGFGKVLKCRDKNTQRDVAVKIPQCFTRNKEVSMLRMLKRNSLEKYNIVEFFDSFKTTLGTAIVFELLDISLSHYILKNRCKPMLLSDIRTIIQQVATAFDALKSFGVIHTDVKPDNIMLVDHQRRPFGVKLIDFGLAIHTFKAERGRALQTVSFRSPEIILGLPYSEAIDMWSLGSVMAVMVSGYLPFTAVHAFDALQLIVKLLGQPADHLLDDGKFTEIYFDRRESNGWRLKDPQEFWDNYCHNYNRSNRFPPLDDLKKMRLERKNEAEAEEREQCIELLKAMLEMDAIKRITPSEVLTHPFIDTANQGHHSSYLQTQMNETSGSFINQGEEDFECEPLASALKDDDNTSNIQPDPRSPSPTITSSIVIEVQPATAENTLQLDCELESIISLQTQMNETSGGFINHEDEDFGNEDFECEPPASALKDDDITNIQPDPRSTSPTITSSIVIEVRPATAENTLQMEDQESAVSLQAELNKKSESFQEVTECDKLTSISEDTNSCEDISTEGRKKKKKNIFRRVFSWVRKNICSCCTCSNEDEEGRKGSCRRTVSGESL